MKIYKLKKLIFEKIYKIKYKIQYKLYRDIFVIKDIDIGYGLCFGGAKNVLIGEEKGYGVFISNTKPNSISDKKEYVKKGWQIIKMNGHDLELATFEELKEALRVRSHSIIMRIKYNPELLENYSYNI